MVDTTAPRPETRSAGHVLPVLSGLLIGLIFLTAAAIGLSQAGLGGRLAEPALIQDWTARHNLATDGATEIIAQVDFSTHLVLTEGDRTAFALPLLAVPTGENEATAPRTALGALVFPDQTTLDDTRLDRLLETTLAMGRHGPVLRLSAQAMTTGEFRPALETALARSGFGIADPMPMLMTMEQTSFFALPDERLLWGALAVLLAAGLILNMRNRATARLRKAAVGQYHRIAAYDPEMATGNSGVDALRRVIAPPRGPAKPQIYSPPRTDGSTADPEHEEVAEPDANLAEEPCAPLPDEADAEGTLEAVEMQDAPPSEHGAPASSVREMEVAPGLVSARTSPAQTKPAPRAIAPAPVEATPCNAHAATDVASGPQARRSRQAAAALFSAVRFGDNDVCETADLSRRELAQLDKDPFVQRLTRLE